MRIEIGGRRTGRTTRMIKWLKDNPYGILVVHWESEAQRLRDMYDPEGIMELGNRIVSADRYLKRGLSFHLPDVAIDNADLVLQQMFGKVTLVTMEMEEE